MIKSTTTLSYENAKELNRYDADKIIIGIRDPSFEPLFGNSPTTLSLAFMDYSPAGALQYTQYREGHVPQLCSHEDARAIVDFLDDWHKFERQVDLYVHCMAGICRSGAVARYAELVYQIPVKTQIHPNLWVLELLVYEKLKKDGLV